MNARPSIDEQIAGLRQPRHGSLIVISGPSGVGKGTLVKQVMARCPDITLSVSMTTRAPRPGEEHGRNYFFVSPAEFASLVEEQAFLEYASYNHNSYGTPRAFVNQQLQAGLDVILEIDVQGAEQVRQNWQGDAVHLFVLPPSEAELRHRLEERRTETPEVIDQRLAQVTQEVAQLPYYDYYVINEQLEKAVEDVLAILQAQRLRVDAQAEFKQRSVCA